MTEELIPALSPLAQSESLAPRRERKKTVSRIFNQGATDADFRRAVRLVRESPDLLGGFKKVRQTTDAGAYWLAERAMGAHEDDHHARALLMADMQNQAEDLAGPNPSAAVLLLAERVIQAKVNLTLLERRYTLESAAWQALSARYSKEATTKSPFELMVSGIAKPEPLDHDKHQKRIERAQRMYLAALKALAEVQRLNLPPVAIAMPGALQVNIMDGKSKRSFEAPQEDITP